MELRFVATIDKADGNDTVGEMWQETCTFPETATLKEVLAWAAEASAGERENPAKLRRTIKITVDQATYEPPQQKYEGIPF